MTTQPPTSPQDGVPSDPPTLDVRSVVADLSIAADQLDGDIEDVLLYQGEELALARRLRALAKIIPALGVSHVAALRDIAALSDDPDDWQAFDDFGDPVDTDTSNGGDLRDHGARVGRLAAAKIARRALAVAPSRLGGELVALRNIICTVRDHVAIADADVLARDVEWLDEEIAKFGHAATPLQGEASPPSETLGLRCAFCGKGKDQVKRFIAGPGVFALICDGCVTSSAQILFAEGVTAPILTERRDDEPPRLGQGPKGAHECPRCHEWCYCAEWYDGAACACQNHVPGAEERRDDEPASEPIDTQRLDWWFANGLNDSVCPGSVDLWWADGEAEETRVTHGTSVRGALDKAMRGIYHPEDEPQ